MRRNRIKAVRSLLSGLGTFFVFVPAVLGENRQVGESPEEIVARLVSLPHGLAFLDPENRSILDKVKANPPAYVEALQRRLDLPDERESFSSVDVLHVRERALSIVREIGPQHGGLLVHRAFTQTADQRRESECGLPMGGMTDEVRAGRHICQFLGEIIDVLAAFKDDYAVEYCLAMVARENYANQTISLRYLEAVAPRRPDIRAKLEALYNAPDSPLRNNPQLKRVLEAMDKAAVEEREAPREKKEDRKNDDE